MTVAFQSRSLQNRASFGTLEPNWNPETCWVAKLVLVKPRNTPPVCSFAGGPISGIGILVDIMGCHYFIWLLKNASIPSQTAQFSNVFLIFKWSVMIFYCSKTHETPFKTRHLKHAIKWTWTVFDGLMVHLKHMKHPHHEWTRTWSIGWVWSATWNQGGDIKGSSYLWSCVYIYMYMYMYMHMYMYDI